MKELLGSFWYLGYFDNSKGTLTSLRCQIQENSVIASLCDQLFYQHNWNLERALKLMLPLN